MKEWNLRILIFILFLLLSENTEALGNRLPGARPAALSGAVVALPGSEGLFHNQAGISWQENKTLSLHYESLFLLKEFSLMSSGAVFPTRAATFGGSFYQFGTGSYRENKIGLVCSRMWGNTFSAALQFDYFSQRLPENRKPLSAVTFEGGILWRTPGGGMAGIHLFNPAGIMITAPSGRYPILKTLRCGYMWRISSMLLLCCEIEKTSHRQAKVKTGVEFNPHPGFSLRAGASGTPLKFTGGAGFRSGEVWMDIAFSYHGNLGYSPSVTLVFSP